MDLTVNPPISPIPPSSSSDASDSIISWLTNAAAEADAFLQAQPGYSQISAAIDAIMSTDELDKFDPRDKISRTRTNRIAKICEDISALMTDTKPFWDYQVANRRFEQHSANFGKLATFWYQRHNADLRLGDVIKYYCAAGTGYLHIFWNPEIGDLDCAALDPRNVFPIRPRNYESLESCSGVIVREKVPVSYVRDRYHVTPRSESDGSALSFLSRIKESIADTVSPIHKWAKSGSKDNPELPRIPSVYLYTAYLKDHSRNETDSDIEMGEFVGDGMDRHPANNWSYTVKPSEPLYPHRRMVVWCGGKRLYDGPMYYWRDAFPILKLTLNPWPWSWFGKAPAWDLLRLQHSLNRLLRVIDDHASQLAQPGAIMDKNNVSRAQYDSFDTRKPGYKIYQNPMAGKGIQIVPPPPLDSTIPAHIKWILDEMDNISGVFDMRQMMRLNQLPSNSTVESILNSMTPALRQRSRVLEAFMREWAMQLAYGFTQFYTLPMRVTILGPGSVTQDDFDFDPGTLIPAYLNDSDYGTDGLPTERALLRGPFPRYQRAQEFLRGFIFKIAPGSLLSAAQVEQKLIYMQLARAGWLDIFTLFEALGIPNVGPLPDNVRTIIDRLQYQQSLQLGMNVNPAGRKASGQEVPRIVTKES